ncbi:signal transducer and activator of transcription B-like [Condylostylus longicornis]|uniref:signal transducer and activator of transcription B-like n=1 Tax=Condylostylus longicornis TaxID=2530218 RepID=UPI00244E500A|nr:signal transducer and activator of transcription B-like [Condylostylus longicornis]
MMEKILIFIVITTIAAASSDMDPKCFVKPPYVNPRTCCLDPTIVKDDLHEKCMRKVFRPNRFSHPDHNVMYDHSEANIIPNNDNENNDSNGNNNDNNDRNKRSVDEILSSLDFSAELGRQDDSTSSSNEESFERRLHRNHHGRHHHRHHGGGHHRHGKHHRGRHHHRRHHHGHHPHQSFNGRNNFDHRYEIPNEYDDTYVPVFHRDFSRWTSISARFQKLSIYWSCIFNETGIIDDQHNVILPNVKSYLSQVLDEDNPFLPVMEEAFHDCKVKREEFMEDLKIAKEHYILDSTPLERQIYRKEHPYFNINTDKYDQKNHAYFLIRCVKRMSYKNCPDDKFRTDDKLCSKSRAYLKTCPYAGRQYYLKN